MSELARTFREARKAQSLSLDEAEISTKIRRRYLEAIEAGDYDQLPDGPPARGFIKNYARFLSLDGDQAIADFEAEVGVPVIRAHEYVPPPPSPSRRRSPSKYTRLEPPRLAWKGRLPEPDDADLDDYSDDGSRRRVFRSVQDMDAVDGDSDGDGDDVMVQRRTGKRPLIISRNSELRAGRSSFRLLNKNGSEALGSIPEISQVLPPKPYRERQPLVRMPNLAAVPKQVWQALAGVVVLIGLGWLITQVIVPRVRNLSLGSPSTARSTAAPLPSGNTSVSPSGETNVRPAVTFVAPGAKSTPGATQVTPVAPVAIAPSPNGLQFSLDAREQAWVQVKVDGNVVYEGIPPLGPGTPWTAKQSISVVTGNAGAFEVIVNGTRIGRLGERNTVARKLFDTTGQVRDFQ